MRFPDFVGRRFAALRTPRRLAVLFLAFAATLLVGVAVVVPGVVPGATSSIAPRDGAPSFTYDGTWSLLELHQHAQSGEVVAVTVAKGASGNAGELVARTLDGQLIHVALTVQPGDATSALANLGLGGLLTEEAWDAAAATAAGTGGQLDTTRMVLAWLLPIGLIVVLVIVLRRIMSRNGLAGRGVPTTFHTILPAAAAPESAGGRRPKAAPAVPEAPRVRLDDVAGCDEAKLELTETIEFLRAPDRFRALGAKIPRGVLLYGPPGTGKTLLARAVAAEAGVPFIASSASEFVEKYVGVGSRRVRELFSQARKHGRAVIFIDEFDALAKARGGVNSHEEREQTLNQLLVELDGFSTTEEVVVIAATNRLDTLDPAVLRPGRFNRKIHVGLPDVAGRRAILEIHARGKPLGTSVDLDILARRTYGFSGAQLADLLNESAILAARRGKPEISDEEIHGGWLKVAVGTARRRSMDERERSIIAAHEIGHAICGRVHGDRRRVEEISLFAHGEALGVTVSSQEDNDLPAESDLRARLVALMGGRAAEELLFQEVTGGAGNDFEQANRIAGLMVTKWGMGRDPEAAEHGPSGRGALSFFVARPGASLPSDVQAAATRATRAILDEAYAEACRTLVANLDLLRRLAAYLVEHERMDGETLDALVEGRLEVPAAADEWRPEAARPRPWAEIAAYHEQRRARSLHDRGDREPARNGARPALVPAAAGGAPMPVPAAAAGSAPTSDPGRAPRAVSPGRFGRGRRPDFGRLVRRAGLASAAAVQTWLRDDGRQPNA